MRIVTEHAMVSDDAVRADLVRLAPYAALLRSAVSDTAYTTPESALAAAGDARTLDDACALAARYGTHLKTVLLVGIGGSDLGARAVYDACAGHLDTAVRDRVPRLIAFDTIEPALLARMEPVIRNHASPEEIALVVVSKSGTTTETLVNARALHALLADHFGADAAARRTILISDAHASFAEIAPRCGMTHVPMPASIGGRFSVFTAVGLVPLALLGMDVQALCAGALAAARAAAPERGASAPATLASLLHHAYADGLRIHELLCWDPALATLGRWYRQLLAESIGKEHSFDGVRVGITPSIAIGSTDLHSLGQLVFGGPRTRFTTFVSADTVDEETAPHKVPASPFTLGDADAHPPHVFLRAIQSGVEATYRAQGLPYAHIALSALSAREVGAFMATQMASVMYLARLFEVNAFDQPNVETYKQETRRILNTK